jgi:hypothetical protein
LHRGSGVVEAEYKLLATAVLLADAGAGTELLGSGDAETVGEGVPM